MRKILFSALAALFFMPAHAIKVQEVVSKKGIKAWLVEDHKTPLVAISYAFRAGSAYDPVGKEGLAALYTRLFSESREDLKSHVFMREIEDLGGYLNAAWDHDYLSFKWRFPSQNRAQM